MRGDVIPLDIAVRAYPIASGKRRRPRRDPGLPSGIVITLDVETHTDLTQRLLFGSYRVHGPTGHLVEEGLIAADDLTDGERRVLKDYRDGERGQPRLKLLCPREFLERIVWRVGFKGRATV